MVKASVMEIYDLQTKVGQGTVLKIHTPTGTNVKRHLFGHFLQYKQFKYLGAKLSLIPASTLPVDPTGLSYEAGDSTVDPRDMVNPILWRHYHGETMLTDTLPGKEAAIYGNNQNGSSNADSYVGSAIDEFGYAQYTNQSQVDYVYPNALMDTSFRKAGIQTGFTTFVKPFVYNVVNAKQMLPFATGASTAVRFSGTSPNGDGQVPAIRGGTWGELDGTYESKYIEPRPSNIQESVDFNAEFVPQLFTNKLTPLGWMDTVQRTHANFDGGNNSGILPDSIASATCFTGSPNVGPYLPKIPMLYVLMPPAYKTEFYFRLIVKHYFAFKGFRSCFSIQANSSACLIQYGIPAPASYGTAVSTASQISSMVLDLEESRTDTIDIENGELRTMADGTEGE